ncbi:MAG: hypothetical protein ACWGOD_03540 [Desulfobulbales bacterium]
MLFSIFGIILMLLGLVVSIVFWLPPIFDRNRVKEVMGNRYPLVYIIYVANGPLLIVFGLLLIIWPKI